MYPALQYNTSKLTAREGQKGNNMKIDFDALDRNGAIIRNAGIKLPIYEDDYFDLLRHARGAGIIDEDVDDVDGTAFADAVRECAELIEHPDRLLPETRSGSVPLGEGYSSPEQPLEAIEIRHKNLLGRYLAHNESERTEIANALSMLGEMSERFHGFSSNGITLYGYKIRNLNDLASLCYNNLWY